MPFAAETFATTVVTTTGSKVFTTTADFSLSTQTSSLASTTPIDFGGLTSTTTNPGSTNKVPALDTETFVLTITENGKVSDIPVNEASWGVSRSITRPPRRVGFDPSQTDFTIKADRGLHSPGLFLASTRGDEIDKAILRRYEIVNGNRVETYRWEMQSVYFTSYSNSMLPGAPASEFDQVSLRSKQVALVSNELNGTGVWKSFGVAWDFAKAEAGGISVAATNDKFGFQTKEKGLVFGAKINGSGEFANIDSYQWGAALSVKAPDKTGTRELGAADASLVSISLTGRPSTFLLLSALKGGPRKAVLQADPMVVSSELTDMLVNSYSYKDTNSSSGAEVKSGFDFVTAVTEFVPTNAKTGQPETSIRVTWDRGAGKTTGNPAFGGFQFNPSAIPAMLLEINDGASKSQLAAQDYSWGVTNPAEQLVGTLASPRPLASRTLSSGQDFLVTTAWDRATPALINAVGSKTMLPEIRITERRDILVNGSLQYLPFREWVLNDVYVSDFGTNPTFSNQRGPVTLAFDAGKVTSNLITLDKSGNPVTKGKSIDFVTPPTVSPLGTIKAVSTDPDRVIDTPSRFVDSQEAAVNLQYVVSVVSGANLFDGVTLNSLNRLVLNFKPGQGGVGQIRVDGTDSMGLTSSLLLNIAVDVDGVSQAPSGFNQTVAFNEDTSYIVKASDFVFSDPNDFPANTLSGVKISSLPAKGGLTLNGVAVALNDVIPVASLNANQLRYTPVTNENGTNYASFTFQVQDNGATSNLDLSPNVFTFNVANVNDAPVMSGTNFTMPAIDEDATNPAGMLLTSLGASFVDVDSGALKGIAVAALDNTNGAWQFALNGTTWQNFGNVSSTTSRLLPIDETTRIRFVPNANFNTGTTPLSVAYRAWDQTTGLAGSVADSSVVGPTVAFSSAALKIFQTVTAINDAPVMTSVAPTLPLIDEDAVFSPGPTSGVPISALLGGVTDVDASILRGIAVFEVSTTGGLWQYSLTNGESWVNFNEVSLSSARLLRDFTDVRVRFLPNANSISEGRLSFFAWDRTQGVSGSTFDLSGLNKTGGSTAFSDTFVTATQTIRSLNDAPTIAAPVTQNVVMDTPVIFSTANANQLVVSDVDAGTQSVQVTITATNGIFTLPTTTNLSFVSGANGQSTFTVTGRVSVINAALNGASFTPNSRVFGNGSLSISVNDQGNSGFGGSKTSSTTVALPIAVPGNTVDMGSLTATVPTIRRSGNRNGVLTTPDFYTFSIAATSDVRVNLSGLSADVDVRVFSSVGQMVGQSIFFSTTIENILMTALPAGTYLIDLRGQVVSAYDLTVSTAPTTDDLITQANVLTSPNATTLPTVRQQATSTAADLQDYYKFSLTSASALRINVSGLSQDVDFELLDSAGRVIQAAAVSNNTIENMLTSSLAAGTYYLRVFAFQDLLTTNYDLTISTNTASDDLLTNATSLGVLGLKGSDRRTGNVAVGTDLQDYYVFSGFGDVAICVSGLSSDADVEVLDRFGRVLTSSSGGGKTAESIIVNIASGSGAVFVRIFAFSGSTNYVFEARGNSNAENADDLLSTATVLPNPISSLTRTGTVGGTGSSGDPQDYYRFQLTSVRNVTLTLTGLTADLDIEVLDQFGQRLFFSQNSGTTNESINVANLGIGFYYIRIYPFTASSISNYTLGLTV